MSSKLSKTEKELRLDNQKIDISLPPVLRDVGSLHPVTQTINYITLETNTSRSSGADTLRFKVNSVKLLFPVNVWDVAEANEDVGAEKLTK